MSAFDDLAERLDAIAEELADVALDRLRTALEDDGADAAAAEERRVTWACAGAASWRRPSSYAGE